MSSPLALAAHDGHRLALALVALAAANAAVSVGVALAERRFRADRRQRLAFGLAVLTIAVAVLLAGLVRYGGPVHIAKRAYASFKAPPPRPSDLNQRLLNFSGNGRVDLWRLAWDEAAHDPILGGGAGTYERYFLAHQPANVGRVRDAHSLYLETLGEIGPLGLVLLAVLLAAPVLALGRARRHPFVPAAFGAYVAYLVHTGVDWDWELPAVTLGGLLCGAAILVSGRTRGPDPVAVLQPLRWGMAGLAVLAAAFATIGLVGNTALSRSRTALVRGNVAAAATDARRAHTLMPWSPQPWESLGRAELRAGLVSDARRSFRKAVSVDPGDWELWWQLAAATTGAEHVRALAHVESLAPKVASGR